MHVARVVGCLRLWGVMQVRGDRTFCDLDERMPMRWFMRVRCRYYSRRSFRTAGEVTVTHRRQYAAMSEYIGANNKKRACDQRLSREDAAARFKVALVLRVHEAQS